MKPLNLGDQWGKVLYFLVPEHLLDMEEHLLEGLVLLRKEELKLDKGVHPHLQGVVDTVVPVVVEGRGMLKGSPQWGRLEVQDLIEPQDMTAAVDRIPFLGSVQLDLVLKTNK